tara:strand:+ start:165 stop:389 length:225 start_codon:yes stop_codon:yes gene_type:complete
MTLKKQSIRFNHRIFMNGSYVPSPKEEIIKLSEEWSENEEILFKKLLQQGGNMKIKGNSFRVDTAERIVRLKDM